MLIEIFKATKRQHIESSGVARITKGALARLACSRQIRLVLLSFLVAGFQDQGKGRAFLKNSKEETSSMMSNEQKKLVPERSEKKGKERVPRIATSYG